jgi:3-oxoacyl-[acyl-carrier protein] reductase
MDLGLNGKVALVAAGSKGLGYGVARALAQNGARVSICSREQAHVDAAVAQLREDTGAEVSGFACDVTKPDQIQAWVESTAAWGPIYGLLVNAGGPPGGLALDMTDAQWQAAFELTLLSSVRMMRAAVPRMTEGGSILTITSSSVREPIERLGLSTVMRSGVAGLVKTLADELAPRHIRANNLIPGRIDTERVAQLDAAAAQRTGKPVEEVRAASIAKIPLGRLGTIDDFGAAGAFLLSPAASYITGATLRVDGGMMRSI